jgi:hypothetical protein
VRRLVVLSVALAALLVLSCDVFGCSITLVNNARDPFHPNGGKKMEVGTSRQVTRMKGGSSMSISLQRMGTTWATLELTSGYDPEDEEDYEATITVTEETYGNFEATSDNPDIVVEVLNR